MFTHGSCCALNRDVKGPNFVVYSIDMPSLICFSSRFVVALLFIQHRKREERHFRPATGKVKFKKKRNGLCSESNIYELKNSKIHILSAVNVLNCKS